MQAENELVSDGCVRPESSGAQRLGNMKGTRINSGIREQTQAASRPRGGPGGMKSSASTMIWAEEKLIPDSCTVDQHTEP
jgi:hypothetical protein